MVSKMSNALVNWIDVEQAANRIVHMMFADKWNPDYLVGVARGGLPLATIISYRTGIPLVTLDASRSSPDGFECLAFAGEDAAISKKKILVVDDVVKTGGILNTLVDDWQSSTANKEWDGVWNNNVRFACMFEYSNNDFDYVVDYSVHEVYSDQEEITFPWV